MLNSLHETPLYLSIFHLLTKHYSATLRRGNSPYSATNRTQRVASILPTKRFWTYDKGDVLQRECRVSGAFELSASTMQPTPPTSSKTGFAQPPLAKARAAPAAGPSTVRSHARNPNPTPAATPPLTAPANRRHGSKSFALHPSIQISNPTTDSAQPAPARARARHSEPIDVDELYERKYSLKPEDLILPIDVATYRQSVRGKGKEREGEVEIVAQRATSAASELAAARVFSSRVFLTVD